MAWTSLEQKRAELAWEQVSGYKATAKADFKKYRSLARNFPSMVQSMGIGQATAFLMSKKKEASHMTFLAHLSAWLLGQSSVPWNPAPSGNAANIDWLITNLTRQIESRVWWSADREAVEYAVWLKRFAEALTDTE